MSKEIEIELEDGTKTKETVYTKEEYEAKAAEATKAQEDAKEAERVAASQKDNFKKFNELTEDEKKAYDANTIELMKRADLSAAENADLKKRLDEKEKRDQDEAKNSSASYYHQGDEKLKTAIDSAYASLAGMPETTKEEIAARYQAAAKLSDIKVNSGPNPLYSSFSGEAPHSPKDNKQFVETAKGQEAADITREAMGIKKPDSK